MKKIELIRKGNNWYAKFYENRVIELFGTDTIMTPYVSNTPESVVLREISAKNPDCIVTVLQVL
jgi:hypothetical protein